jgi:hypothetical protein
MKILIASLLALPGATWAVDAVSGCCPFCN